jgi:hypothetical protein
MDKVVLAPTDEQMKVGVGSKLTNLNLDSAVCGATGNQEVL